MYSPSISIGFQVVMAMPFSGLSRASRKEKLLLEVITHLLPLPTLLFLYDTVDISSGLNL